MISKKDLIDEFIKLNNEYQETFPNTTIPRDKYRRISKYDEKEYIDHFGSYSAFKKFVFPKKEKGTKEKEEKYNRNSFDICIDSTKKSKGKRYFVTSIVAGANINDKFFKCILNYCKLNNAELLLLVMRGVKMSDSFDKDTFLKYKKYFVTEFKFNENLAAMDFLISPQQIIPLTGLKRFGKKDFSVIIASTKQMLESVPVRKGEISHIICSTGTISEPNYSLTRQGRLAKQDNKLGGIIVEIQSNKIFHLRQVQWKNDSICDINKLYTTTTRKKEIPEAFILGDLHIGEDDKRSLTVAKEIIKETGVKNIFIHDICSMRSISHHEQHNVYARYSRPEHQKTLEKELNYLGKFLIEWTKDIKNCKFIVVASNHDEHLNRYLYEGRFVTDEFNAKLAAKLFIHLLDNKNPLEEYLKENFNLSNNFIFLKRDESYKCAGIECGNHGDIGNSGGRGSSQSQEISYGKSVIGHSHTPRIFRDVYQVGTNSKLRLSYNLGGSAWIHSDCLIFKNGSRQLINKIEGHWKI